MRTKLVAALAATTLAGAALATAGSAAAEGDAPAKTAARPAGADLKSAVSARGNVRLSGADRYETAVEISKSAWDQDNALVVYLASGTSLPDALAAGPSTLGSGPVLLTERDRLPEVTRTELQRLRPCYLVVLGGTPSVSDAVFADAEQYADATGCPA